MAVFNTASYLEAALNSIKQQTYTDFEFVVVDDGSVDGSVDLLQAFAGTEPRTRLTLRKNRGLIATRNELLQSARGDLIAWMDSDDVSLPHRLDVQVREFEIDPELICLGGAAQCVDPEGNELNIERYPRLHSEILAGQQAGGAMRFPTTMMRRDAALKVGGFREPFRIGEDLDLFLRMSEIGKMSNLSEVIYLYRQHLTSSFFKLSSEWLQYRAQILELAKERRERGSDRLQRGEPVTITTTNLFSSEWIVGSTYANWAKYALQNGNPSLALKYAKAAVFAKPTNLKFWRLLIRARTSTWMNRPTK